MENYNHKEPNKKHFLRPRDTKKDIHELPFRFTAHTCKERVADSDERSPLYDLEPIESK